MRRARQEIEARTWDVFPNKETQRCFPKQDRSLKTDNNEFTLWRRKDCTSIPGREGVWDAIAKALPRYHCVPKRAYRAQAAERQHGCKPKQSGSQVHSNPYESSKSPILIQRNRGFLYGLMRKRLKCSAIGICFLFFETCCDFSCFSEGFGILIA